MKFNPDIFFNHVRPLHFRWCKTGLNQNQVDGINFLIEQIERDPIWKSIETIAYALATTAWETAWTFQPIDERGSYSYFERRYGFQTKVGKRLGNDAPGEGAKYHGRGDVQLTGETNYENAEDRLRRFYPQLVKEFEKRTGQKFDLTDSPDQAKDPLIAYAIMALGMHQGWFTGKHFGSYKTKKYLNWRKIINATDHADEIAAIAEAFEKALRLSFISDNVLIKFDDQPAVQIGKPTEKTADNPDPNTPNLQADSQSPPADNPQTQPVASNTLPEKEETPDAKAQDFSAYIPQIDTAKKYLNRAFSGSVLATSGAVLLGLPLWIQITLAALVLILVIGGITLFIRYYKDIFAFVTQMNTLRATQGADNPILTADKS